MIKSLLCFIALFFNLNAMSEEPYFYPMVEEPNMAWWQKKWFLMEETIAFLENNECTRHEAQAVIRGLCVWYSGKYPSDKNINKIAQPDPTKETGECRQVTDPEGLRIHQSSILEMK